MLSVAQASLFLDVSLQVLPVLAPVPGGLRGQPAQMAAPSPARLLGSSTHQPWGREQGTCFCILMKLKGLLLRFLLCEEGLLHVTHLLSRRKARAPAQSGFWGALIYLEKIRAAKAMRRREQWQPLQLALSTGNLTTGIVMTTSISSYTKCRIKLQTSPGLSMFQQRQISLLVSWASLTLAQGGLGRAGGKRGNWGSKGWEKLPLSPLPLLPPDAFMPVWFICRWGKHCSLLSSLQHSWTLGGMDGELSPMG